MGGVINFISLDEFDGLQLDLGYDTGDDYDATRAAILAGTNWDGGSGYISLSTTDRDAVLNEDRDWAAQGNWNEDGSVVTPNGTECIIPVGAVTTWYWYGAGWTDNPLAPGAGVTPVGDPCDRNGKSDPFGIANTEEASLKGIDFGIQYTHETGIGSFAYSPPATTRRISAWPRAAPRLTSSSTTLTCTPRPACAGRRNTNAAVTLKYTDEYDADPSVGVNRSKVDDFLVTYFFVGYDFTDGMAEGLSLRFNVDNVFDEDPPEYRSQQNLNYSGYTLGRVYKFGLTYRM